MTQKMVVIFDWDGTLYDSEGLLEMAVAHALRALAISESEQIRRVLNNPTENGNIVEAVCGELSVPQSAAFRSRIAIDFAILERAATLKKGMLELLEYLQGEGAALCVATGRSRRRFEADITKLKLRNVFAATVCANEGRPKPHGDCILKIIETLQVIPKQCIFVGDSQADETCASLATVPFLGVRVDYRTGTPLSGFLSTTAVAVSAQALREMLSSWITMHKSDESFPLSTHRSLEDKADV